MADVFKNLGFVEDSAPQAAPKSDPFAGLGFVEDKPAEEAPSSLEAGLRGLGQGASLGFLDEGAGALGALGDKLSGNDSSLLDLYTKHRDEERKRNDAAKAAHPYLYGGGNIAGSIGSLAVGGGALGLGKLGLVARGALEAGAMGLGESNADLTQGDVGQAAKDTLMSASTGALMGKAGEIAAPYLQTAANNAAVGATGVTKALAKKFLGTNKLQEMGQALNDAKVMRPFGSTADLHGRLTDVTDNLGQGIESGINDLDQQGVKIGNTQDIANEVKQKITEPLSYQPSGQQSLDKVNDYLNNTFVNYGKPAAKETLREPLELFHNSYSSEPNNHTFQILGAPNEQGYRKVVGKLAYDNGISSFVVDPAYQGQGIGKKILEAAQSHGLDLTKATKGFTPEGSGAINSFLGEEATNPTLPSQSADWISNHTPLTNTPLNATGIPVSIPENAGASELAEQGGNELGIKEGFNVRKGIDSDINWTKRTNDLPGYQQGLYETRTNLQNRIQKAIPEGSDLSGKFNQYHLLQTAEDMAAGKAAAQTSNRMSSPSDYAASAIGGIVAHGVPGAAAAGAVNHILRTRGSQTAAWGLTNISNLLAENPEAFGRFSGPLLMAAKRGSQALAASHFVLQQSEPAYRAINEAYQNTFSQGAVPQQ